jgi:hypothetical protein
LKKKIITLAVAALTLVATASCKNEIRDRGTAIAQHLAQSWNDSTATAKCVTEYDNCRDSIKSATDKDDLSDAFITSAGESNNDTLIIAAQAIAMTPGSFGKATSGPIIDALINGSFSPRDALQRITLVHSVASRLGRGRLIDDFDQAIQQSADSLPVDQQMQLYAHSCSPAILGRALRDDRMKNGADLNKVNAQVEALRKIYSDGDFKTFKQNYEIK